MCGCLKLGNERVQDLERMKEKRGKQYGKLQRGKEARKGRKKDENFSAVVTRPVLRNFPRLSVFTSLFFFSLNSPIRLLSFPFFLFYLVPSSYPFSCFHSAMAKSFDFPPPFFRRARLFSEMPTSTNPLIHSSFCIKYLSVVNAGYFALYQRYFYQKI